MLRKTTIAVGLMLVLAQVGLAAVDPSLVGWWRLDEGGGTVAIDSSGTGNNGELMGGPQYVDGVLRGALEFNGTDQFVEIPHAPSLTVDTEVTVMCWFNAGRAGGGTGDNWQGLIAKSNGPRSYSLYTRVNNVFHFSVGPGGAFVGSSSSGTFTLNEWTHVAAQVVGGQHQYWVNGEDAGTGGAGTVLPGAADTGPVYIGRTAEGLAGRAFLGMIDDARIYSRALSQGEIAEAMKGNLFPIAESPFPQDESPDVVRDVDLTWTAGEFAQTHDVYFGAAWDDVNAASTDAPLGVLVGQGQSADTFDPGRLGFSQTYYWRVDEVNAAPDSTVFKGDVWSFTVEPFSIPIDTLTATASSSFGASTPEKTIDGSGMTGDAHGTAAGDMWISGGIPATLEYAFDRAYKLHELWIWNSNQLIEAFVGFGAKDVVVEHSLDGENWTVLDGVGPLAQATGTEGYAHNSTIDFGGAVAQHVRVTVNSVQGIAPQASLSEVRFYYLPVNAREPQPVEGAMAVGVEETLQWRSGREADRHDLYIGTDLNSLALAGSVSESSFDTLAEDLQLSQTYYWRVDEVNEAMDPSVWTGDVWSFTTVDTIGIDDMESYKNEEFLEIWATWIDGFDDPSNGSLVGVGAAGTPETDVVHGGSQSLPMGYDNRGAAQSEATRTFAVSQDWTRSGVTHLVVWFHGAAGNTGQMYLKINGTKIPYDGPAGNIALAAWQAWSIDLPSLGMNLQSVRSLTVGVEGNGATGILYVDDIALVQSAPEAINEWRVAAGTDDAEEKVLDGGTMDLTSSDLELGYEGNMAPAALQTIGVRWVGIAVPRGATITEAWVQFSADDVDNPYHALPVSQVIEGQLSPNPETFAATLGVISSRATTSAEVVWDIPQWLTVHAMGPEERTPDISSIIQEIVNQPDWSGEALVLLFADNPANPSEGAREAESFNGSASDAPLLHISFE